MANAHIETEASFMNDPIIVALDFGTTYTGVAWIRRSRDVLNPHHIPVIKRWPSRVAPQVRSEIEYDAKGKMLRWGYLEGQKRQRYRFSLLKNMIAVEEKQRQPLEEIFGSELPESITIRSIITDYLDSVLKYAIDQLKKEDEMPEEVRANDNLLLNMMEFVITHPACWSGKTKRAHRAILSETTLKKFMDGHKVYYLTEPEAALIGTLHAPHRRPPSLVTDLSGGADYKQVAILDIGGGTLDFSVYNVKTWNPFKVDEILCTGTQIGGSDVDKIFWDDFLKTLEVNGVEVKKLHPRSKDAIIHEFERLKCSFPEDSEYVLPLPRDPVIPHHFPQAMIEDGRLLISHKQMEKFFDSVIINSIIPFLNLQKGELVGKIRWDKTVLFLVGGFGGSTYLQNKIKHWAKETRVHKVSYPQNSWTAVVCGAAKFGLYQSLKEEGVVMSRISQCSIGIVRDIRWKRGKHTKAQRRKNPGHIPVVKNQIQWLALKGQTLKSDQIKLERTFKKWPSKWTEMLVQSDKEKPSTDLKAKDVTPFGEIEVSVEGVPVTERVKSSFLVFGRYYKINYTLKITFPGSDLVAEMRYKGNNYGKGRFEFPSSKYEQDAEKFAEEVFNENT